MSKHGPAVMIVETTIDDMNPQVYEWVMERLFKAGALEVTLQSVMAKKNRPTSRCWKSIDRYCFVKFE